MDRPIRPEQLTDADLPVEFGRFTLLRVLGHGNMARVFLAQMRSERGFRKKVALKVVRATVAEGQQTFRDALINEARLGGLLHHPNVVETYDFGEIDEQPWIAMERVDGTTLAHWLHALGRLPVRAVLELGIQVCRGLEHAHQLTDDGEPVDLVHRDLKPANVMVDRSGVTKVMDFGIAKATIRTGPPTMVGQTRGTPSYMSPEQAQGRPLDHRSDLFALGTMLYECLTGTRLFVGGSALAAMEEVGRVESYLEDGAIASGADAALPGLGDVLVRCLRLDPDSRYADAGALQQELEALLATGPPGESLAELGARLVPPEPPPARPGGKLGRGSDGPRETLPDEDSAGLDELSLDPTTPSELAGPRRVRATVPGLSALDSGADEDPAVRRTQPDGASRGAEEVAPGGSRRRLPVLLAFLALAVAGAIGTGIGYWATHEAGDRVVPAAEACSEGEPAACLCDAVWTELQSSDYGSRDPNGARTAIADRMALLGVPTADPLLLLAEHHGTPNWDVAEAYRASSEGWEEAGCECLGARFWLADEIEHRYGTRFCLGAEGAGCTFTQAPLTDEVLRESVYACNYFVQCDDTAQWEAFVDARRGRGDHMSVIGPRKCVDGQPALGELEPTETFIGFGAGPSRERRRARPSDSWRFQGRATILVDPAIADGPTRDLFDMAWTLVPHYTEFRYAYADGVRRDAVRVRFPEASQGPERLRATAGFSDTTHLVLVLQVRGPVLRIVAGSTDRSPMLPPGTTFADAERLAARGTAFDAALESPDLRYGPWVYQVWSGETMKLARLTAVYGRSPHVEHLTLDRCLMQGESDAIVIETLSDLGHDPLLETLDERLAGRGIDVGVPALVIAEDGVPLAATLATLGALGQLGFEEVELTGVAGAESPPVEVICTGLAEVFADPTP